MKYSVMVIESETNNAYIAYCGDSYEEAQKTYNMLTEDNEYDLVYFDKEENRGE